MSILVIDDDASYFLTLTQALSRLHTVNYIKSYEVLERQHPEDIRTYDVIICESEFDAEPDAGLRIIAQLREQIKFTNRIILHTYKKQQYFTGERDIKKLRVEYVQKQEPYTADAIIAALSKEAA